MGKKAGTKNRKTMKERFWEKVTIKKSGCWDTHVLTANPPFHVDIGIKKNMRHVAWYIENGEFPVGVLENKCGNRKCVNPYHCNLISSWEDRFWLYTDKKGKEECWIWIGGKDVKGYGILHHPITTKAHRLSWIIHFGDIPDGMLICHHCDNTSCVNPDHLFMGTYLDNNLDKIRKGRHKGAQGERNFGSILTEKQVMTIKFLYGSGEFSTYFLSDVFQVSRNCISRVINGKTWRYMK